MRRGAAGARNLARCLQTPLLTFPSTSFTHPSATPPSLRAAPARKRAYVKDARKCTVCRECVRVPGWGERVRIERVANHFIFTVESTGALTSRELGVEALRILAGKARELQREVGGGGGGGEGGGGGGALPTLSPAAMRARMLSTMREGRGEAED